MSAAPTFDIEKNQKQGELRLAVDNDDRVAMVHNQWQITSKVDFHDFQRIYVKTSDIFAPILLFYVNLSVH